MTAQEACNKLNAERDKHPEMSMKEWYREVYLRSSHWASLRKAAKKRHGEKCNRCPEPGTDVHHKNYKYIYDVTTEDLEIVCRQCHDIEHGLMSRPVRRRKKKKVHRDGPGKMPTCPQGVSKSQWYDWVMGGKKGDPPKPKERKEVIKEWARPPGVPRKAWADWVAHGRLGPQPKPVEKPPPNPCPPGMKALRLHFHPKKQKKLFIWGSSPKSLDLKGESQRMARLEAAKWA